MNRKTEILAPAGSLECVIAAVRTGADAVYFGTKSFNARRNADNFGNDELKQAIEYCHSRGVRVHITLNTLISDEEMPAAVDVIKHVCSLGADVLILQDLGLASLAKQLAPDLERHASTQMSVQTPQGIELLKNLGYSRAVLPRELSREEIINIRKSTDIEIEMFVHGALCMCVSGQCYMSAMLGSRSGNRGLCAQPCRLMFSANKEQRHDLSLKDLSLIDRLPELEKLGIDSFKIEGRMKRPEYVAAAVSSARASLDKNDYSETVEALKAVFSRSGFTSGYYDKRLGADMFGIRTKQDVAAASSKVLSSLERLYDKERQSIGVEFYLSILEGEKPSLTAKAKGKTVFAAEDVLPEKAINKPLTEEGLIERISKCGGTPFFAQKVEVELDEGLIVPAGVINSLRRNALIQLEAALSSVKATNFTGVDINELLNSFGTEDTLLSFVESDSTIISDARQTKTPGCNSLLKSADCGSKLQANASKEEKTNGRPNCKECGEIAFNVRIDGENRLPDDLRGVENLILPLNVEEKLAEKVKNLKNMSITPIVEIPRGIFSDYSKIEKLLERAKSMGIKTAYCSTLDAVAIARKAGMEIHTGFSMNIYNSFSVNELEKLGVKAITLSPELTLEQVKKIKSRVKKGIIAYGHLPLMLTRNCPIRNVKTCAECKRSSFLTDRMGVKFPVQCTMGCSEILNSRPIYLGDRLDEIKNADFITFWFTVESREEVNAVLDAYRNKKATDKSFTRGLYYRGVE